MNRRSFEKSWSFFSRTSLFSKPLKKSKKTFYENILGNQSCLVSSIVSKLLNIYFCKIPILFNCSIPRLKVILSHEDAVLFFEQSSKPRLFYEKRASFVPFSRESSVRNKKNMLVGSILLKEQDRKNSLLLSD